MMPWGGGLLTYEGRAFKWGKNLERNQFFMLINDCLFFKKYDIVYLKEEKKHGLR